MAQRDPKTGRFLSGNKSRPGNPYSKHLAALRDALMRAVTPEDLQEIVRVLVDRAKQSDLQAAKEILQRTLGKPLEADLLGRIETLEQHLQKHTTEPVQTGRKGKAA